MTPEQEYGRLAQKLVALGTQTESPAADAIRDRMDALWLELPETARGAARHTLQAMKCSSKNSQWQSTSNEGATPMDRFTLTKDQKTELHERRKAVETEIRACKAELRKPHTSASSSLQSRLPNLKYRATALYALLAASRGRTHCEEAPALLDDALKCARHYKANYASNQSPRPLEWVGLQLLDAQQRAEEQQPAA